MRVLAIDPGTTQSAAVLYAPLESKPVYHKMLVVNDTALRFIHMVDKYDADVLAIEMVACYGMPVGADVFETVLWAGRFVEAWGGPWVKIYRKDVKMHLCNSARAKDGNVRQALIDRFGPGKEQAIGLKKTPGPLYGFKADMWAALGVAVTACDTRPQETWLEWYGPTNEREENERSNI